MSPLLTLGVALLAGYPLGILCRRFSIPRVTGYLLAGILLGPFGLGRFAGDLPGFVRPFLLEGDRVRALWGVEEMAQALILFSIGVGLSRERIEKPGGRLLAWTAADMGLSFVLTALAVYLATGFTDPVLALVLGAVGVATAPAATLLVLRELESEGPVTRRVLTLVGLDNIGSLLLFALLFGSLVIGNPVGSLQRLGLGAVVGLGTGLMVAVILLRRPTATTFAVAAAGGVLACFGLARSVGGDPLLGCLVLGATVANTSPYAAAVRDRLKQIDYPIYVIFFVLAGADLHVDLLLGMGEIAGRSDLSIPLLTFAYIAGRSAGKMLSGPVVRRAGADPVRGGGRTGMALMAQAGLAIALADAAVASGGAEGRAIQAVVLASVAVFELVGPLLVRYAVVHAGEVRLVHLLPDRTLEGFGESVVDTLARLRRSLGLSPFGGARDPAGVRAQDVMRRHVRPIRAGMGFEEVLHRFAEGFCDQYPVVDDEGVFRGVISFPEIRTILFDDVLAEVVVAADLITEKGVTCAPETTLPEIIAIFEECRGEYSHLPVIENGRVVGMLAQRDAVVAYRKHPPER